MARENKRDAGGGRRRRSATFMASAWALLMLLAIALPGCDLTSPTSPNNASALTGQATNQQFTFNGTISVTTSASTVSADDLTAVTITADVRDPSGNPIPNLTTVTFTTNLGVFNLGGEAFTQATAGTFNGLAQVALQSYGRAAGTATVTAQIGTTAGSTQVTFEPAPLQAIMSASFGTSGTGAPTATGAASPADPLDIDVSALATDTSGATQTPLAGGTVRFRITRDTSQDSQNGPARFIISGNVLTNANGVATNKVRIVGAGDVVIAADLIDPNTGGVAATSNYIIATSTGGTSSPTITFAFSDGSTTKSFGATAPAVASDTITATVKDAAGDLASGETVRFEIVTDTAGTATLSDGTAGPLDMTTSSTGLASTTISLTATGQAVVIRATLLDSSGNPTAVWMEISATYD